MKISNDILRVYKGSTAPDGTPMDSGERPAQRALIVDAVAHNPQGDELGPTHAAVTYDAPLETLAQEVRSRCRDCVHFDRRAWLKLAREYGSSPDMAKRKVVAEVREKLYLLTDIESNDMHQTQEGDYDVDQALVAMGICHPLTEIEREPIVVHPLAGCPLNLSNGSPAPFLFAPKDAPTDERINAAFDSIMEQAAR